MAYMYEMLIVHMMSCMGCVGEPATCRSNFPLKYMAMFVVFNRFSLPYVAEFSSYLHTDMKFQNQPMY